MRSRRTTDSYTASPQIVWNAVLDQSDLVTVGMLGLSRYCQLGEEDVEDAVNFTVPYGRDRVQPMM